MVTTSLLSFHPQCVDDGAQFIQEGGLLLQRLEPDWQGYKSYWARGSRGTRQLQGFSSAVVLTGAWHFAHLYQHVRTICTLYMRGYVPSPIK